MKKIYIKPKTEIISILKTEVLLASGGIFDITDGDNDIGFEEFN